MDPDEPVNVVYMVDDSAAEEFVEYFEQMNLDELMEYFYGE